MSKTVKEISMTISELYQIRRDCLLNDDKDTVFFCYKAGKLVKTLSAYDAGFACSKKEFESFDVIEYYNIESVIVYTKTTNSCVEEVEVEEVEAKEEVKEYKVQVCDLSFTETIQDVIDNCEKAFGLDFDFLKYENIECVESLQTAYLQGNEFSIDGAYGHENYRTKIEIETTEQKETIYHNENSDWYLINDNYKDAETIEEEEIDLTQYKIVKIESSECDIDYGFDSMNGVAKCYTWEGQDGKWFLEEEGCFTKFNSCEELENFMNSNDRFEL